METRRRPQAPSTGGSTNYNIEDGPAAVFDITEDPRKRTRSIGSHIMLFVFVFFVSLLFFSSILFPSAFTDMVHTAEDKVFLQARKAVIKAPIDPAPAATINRNQISSSLVTANTIAVADPPRPQPQNQQQIKQPENHPQQEHPLVPHDEKPVDHHENREQLQAKVDRLISSIRDLKNSGVVMEEDEHAKEVIKELQTNLRQLLTLEYGPGPYFLEMKLKFPESMPDYATAGGDATIIIKMAPIELVPYSVYYFLNVVKQWKVHIDTRILMYNTKCLYCG